MPARRVLRQQELGLALLLVSLAIFFAAAILAFVLVRPVDVAAARLPAALWWSTAALLAGSVCLHQADRQVRREHQRAFRQWLVGACLCGTAFVVLQSYGLWQLVTWHLESTGNSRLWVVLFFLVGLHAAHVLAGVLVLGVVTVRAFHGRFDHEFHPGVTLCGRYWHFLDVVWLVMLAVFVLTLS